MKVHPAIKQITCESLQPLTAARINDDDYYVWDDKSLIVVRQTGPSSPRPQAPAGHSVATGLTIKCCGLRLQRWVSAVSYVRGAA